MNQSLVITLYICILWVYNIKEKRSFFMFNNIGSKIKTLANVLFWGGIFLSLIIAVGFFIIYLVLSLRNTEDVRMLIAGIVYLIAGPIFALINGLLLYGFGELIEKTVSIERNICKNQKFDSQEQVSSDRMTKLNSLRAQNLITEEEYQQALHSDKME